MERGMAEHLTVTQFNEMISKVVGGADSLHDIIIVGEISSIKTAQSGHLYMDLKDTQSSIRCLMFRSAASRLSFVPKVGMVVSAFGSISFYIKGGSLGFNIEGMTEYGKGGLQAALEALAAKLLAEGLFDAQRKRPLPRYPHAIGVVTSATGAVIKDIIDTTARRYPVDIILAPATVQGDEAAASIVHGLKLLASQKVDVIIVGRGGGSADDLSAFNDESVVRAVAASPVPVISAVGHATDKSLTDRVADVYAETPTAAATLATPDRQDEMRNIRNLEVRMNRSLTGSVQAMRSRFSNLDSRLVPRSPRAMVDGLSLRLSQLSVRADGRIEAKLSSCRSAFGVADAKFDPRRLKDRLDQLAMELDDASGSADAAVSRSIDSDRKELAAASQMLDGLDPLRVLGRGYSFIRDPSGKVLTSVSQLDVGSDVRITMRDGAAVASVKEVKKK
jgi:exodeoxyribonuclease VII large subunit